MRFADLAATSDAVAATSRRSAKVAALAAVLARLAPAEVAPAIGMLTGEPRQGRIGVGWASIAAVGERPPATDPTLEVLDVDRALTEVAATTGAGSRARRAERLAELLDRATAAEADLLRRLLVGELRQGALDGVVAEAVARAGGVPAADVRRAAMLSGSLAAAAVAALGPDPAGALAAIGLTVGRFVQPMLAAAAPDVDAALAETGPAQVEWKLDGVRIQVHRDGSDVVVFTRNGNDVTSRLPVVVERTLAVPAGRLVLDGEALGVAGDGRPRRFQDTLGRLGTESVPGPAAGELAPFWFDVVHLDGDDLIDAPLVERSRRLSAVAAGDRVPFAVVDAAAEAAAVVDEALGRGHEGVVVKALDARYDAGRRGGSWRKVKPVRTVDLVVLAAEWGHGRRTGWLSNLHLGARGPDGTFVMVGKTFKGLTDDLLRWQTARLQELAVASTGHVVHVAPELVVEVALDGVQASTRYPGGVALRFARVRRYRDDKRPADADTIDAVRALLPA